VWTGAGFDVDGEIRPVLANDTGASGWSDELADLVNLEVAPDRPLGIASRRHAIDALRRAAAVGTGKTVLEIGCANGFLLEDIASAFPDTVLLGSDYALPPLEQLAARLPAVPLVQLDLVRSNLPDSFCDAVVMLNVLEHIEDDAAALEQVHRMLKPGGTLVIEVPSSPSLYDNFDRLVGHFRRYTMGDLVKRLERAGFSVSRKSHLGFFVFPVYWPLVQVKKLVSADSADDPGVASSRVKAGRKSAVQSAIFSLETALRPIMPMPFGVRCLVSATA
jgi:SAM-dependent methyltransferase